MQTPVLTETVFEATDIPVLAPTFKVTDPEVPPPVKPLPAVTPVMSPLPPPPTGPVAKAVTLPCTSNVIVSIFVVSDVLP